MSYVKAGLEAHVITIPGLRYPWSRVDSGKTNLKAVTLRLPEFYVLYPEEDVAPGKKIAADRVSRNNDDRSTGYKYTGKQSGDDGGDRSTGYKYTGKQSGGDGGGSSGGGGGGYDLASFGRAAPPMLPTEVLESLSSSKFAAGRDDDDIGSSMRSKRDREGLGCFVSSNNGSSNDAFTWQQQMMGLHDSQGTAGESPSSAGSVSGVLAESATAAAVGDFPAAYPGGFHLMTTSSTHELRLNERVCDTAYEDAEEYAPAAIDSTLSTIAQRNRRSDTDILPKFMNQLLDNLEADVEGEAKASSSGFPSPSSSASAKLVAVENEAASSYSPSSSISSSSSGPGVDDKDICDGVTRAPTSTSEIRQALGQDALSEHGGGGGDGGDGEPRHPFAVVEGEERSASSASAAADQMPSPPPRQHHSMSPPPRQQRNNHLITSAPSDPVPAAQEGVPVVPGDNTAALLASMTSSSSSSSKIKTGGSSGTFDTWTRTAANEEESALCSQAANNVYQVFRCSGRLLVSAQFDGHEYCIPGSMFFKEYVKLTGTRLDHEALGFHALSDFIRSIPWVRRIIFIRKYPGPYFSCLSIFLPTIDGAPTVDTTLFRYCPSPHAVRRGGGGRHGDVDVEKKYTATVCEQYQTQG